MYNYFIDAITKPLPEMVAYFNKENEYLKNLINKDSWVLDFGCGTGRTMKFLAEFVDKVVGIDYDKNILDIAQTELKDLKNVELIYNDFFAANFRYKFDLVFASYNLIGSAEISEEQRQLLIKKMVDCTKPGGHIVASAWGDSQVAKDFDKKYYKSLGIEILGIEGNDVITNAGIFNRFSQDELERLLSCCFITNFKIIPLTDIFYLVDIIK